MQIKPAACAVRALLLSLAVLLSLGSCLPLEEGDGALPAGEDGAGKTPEDLLSDWVQMWNAYDLDRLGDLFLSDDRVTYFSSEYEGVIRGFDALVEHHRGFGFVPGGTERGSRLWVEEVTLDILGRAAILTGIWFFRREGGEASTQRGPVTFVAILEGGGWRFVHMNFAAYPDPDPAREVGSG